MPRVHGLHHITAISGPAQENVDFYAGLLGMRLVKKSVNQDDPTTYHLFYADAEGHPGADLTFFPWAHMAPPRMGHGLAVEVSLEIPSGSIEYWQARLDTSGIPLGAVESRFGDRVLPAIDPHGMRVALVEPASPRARLFTPWQESPVPVERQVRGLHSARLWERQAALTTGFLTEVLGFEHLGTEEGWMRFGFTDVAGGVDIRETPDERRGAWGVGCVHHLAWRVDDDTHELAMRAQIEAAGARPTPVIDRFWFKSVYFKEPGGVLFELATDGPGFAVDEAPEHLGTSLVLPPWLERQRTMIESGLETLKLPTPNSQPPTK